MEQVYEPFVRQKVAENSLPKDQKSILYIDCYPVHLGEQFQNYLTTNHPNVFLVYVPANCAKIPFESSHLHSPNTPSGTGLFQPADVGLQRIIKHRIRQDTVSYLVKQHKGQLKQGLTANQVKFETSLPRLRDASVPMIVHAWDFLNSLQGQLVVRRVSLFLIQLYNALTIHAGMGKMHCRRMESLSGVSN
jgi:hypothetical protein